jgi:2-polyprenyl-6-methoxyphenol hydroxylase-like FAD-dependent oxidoreductase
VAAKKDIRIIGAGPAGLVAAINLKREGFNAIVQERQDSVGGEPALGFGITGALVSGKIAALAVTDPHKAEAEFNRFTGGILTHIARKRQPGYVPSVKIGDVWFDIG